MIKLSCNSCGAKLELTDDIDRFSCMHCGSEWLVNKGGGTASLKPVEEKLERLEEKTDKVIEHTEILADQIRMQKIRERLGALRTKKLTINTKPMMANPEWLSLDRECIQYNAKYGDFNASLFLLGTILFIISSGIGLGYLSAIGQINRVTDFALTNFFLVFPATLLYLAICYAIGYMFLAPGKRKKPPEPENLADSLPQYVPDENQRAINEAQIKEIDNEIYSLTDRIVKMEQKI
jgi:DNA-directed RNA polymerase subunit RPC12/RpoP